MSFFPISSYRHTYRKVLAKAFQCKDRLFKWVYLKHYVNFFLPSSQFRYSDSVFDRNRHRNLILRLRTMIAVY